MALTDELVIEFLASHGITLDAAGVAGLRSELEMLSLPADGILFREGEPSEHMFVLLAGRLSLRVWDPERGEVVVDELGPGTSVGVASLTQGRPRTATAVALEQVDYVRLSRAGFERLGANHPAMVGLFDQTIVRPRVQRGQLKGVLPRFFGALEPQAIGALERELVWRRLARGEVLFREGDPGGSMFIVIAGRLQVTTTGEDGAPTVVGTVGRGESVGEYALLTGDRRAATVAAARDTEVVELSAPAFEHFIASYPGSVLHLTRLIVQRAKSGLAGQHRQVPGTLSVAVVPLARDLPVEQLTAELCDALRPHGATLHLDPVRLEARCGIADAAHVGPDHPKALALAGWLADRESDQAFLVYQADPEWSGWTQRCVRQADVVLLLADADAAPAPGALESAVAAAAGGARLELALLHPAGRAAPRGTAAWLDARRLAAHHHLRQGDAAQTAQLARRLAGRTLGVVLAGGGARGYAHVGALRAMLEAGLRPDQLGGTSMGALMGGIFALTGDCSRFGELGQRFGSRRAILDFTPPLVALTASRKVTGLLQDIFGDTCIEDLWRPYFCVATDLTAARAVIHRRGPLWQAVRTSISLPGVFTPVWRDGHLLSDGGLLNNFPLDVMRADCGTGTVIGVSVSAGHDPRVGFDDFGWSLSGWRALGRSLVPGRRKPKVPSLLDSLTAIPSVAGAARFAEQLRHADLVIRAPVGRFGALDFDAWRQLSEIGYIAARDELAEWLPASRLNAASSG